MRANGRKEGSTVDKGAFTVYEHHKRPGKWGYTYWLRGRCPFRSCYDYVSKRAAVKAIGRLEVVQGVPVYDIDGNQLN